MGKEFSFLFKDFATYVLYGLKKHDEISICRMSLHCTGDLIRSLEEEFSPYVPQFVPLVINIINDPIYDRTVKTVALNVLSDSLLYVREASLYYFGDIMTLITNALEAGYYIPKVSVIYYLIKG